MTNKLTLLLCCTLALCLALPACRKIEQPEPLAAEKEITALPVKAGVNPFSVANVNRALAWIGRLKQSGASRNGAITESDIPSVMAPLDTIGIGEGGGPLLPNYQYVRFLPADIEQLTTLEDEIGFDLWDTPLDVDMANEPEFYQDPTLPAEAITWQYTVVPMGYPLPRDIRYEILSPLFLFNDDDGEPNEVEEEWTGDIVREPATDGRQRVSAYLQQTGSPMARSRKALKEAAPGLSAAALYKAIMVMSGHLEEVEEETGAGTRKARYYPEGYLKVENTDIPVVGGDGPDGTEPLKVALVKSRNFFKLAHTYTDANGYFKINKGYKRKANIVVKFKNDRCAIKGISGSLKIWQYAFPVKKKIGKYSRTDMQNIRHTFPYSLNPKSNEARIWSAATTLNARWDMDKYNSDMGLPALPYLKIWMYSKHQEGRMNGAPMGNSMNRIGSGSFGCQFTNTLSGAFQEMVGYFIGSFIGSTVSAANIAPLLGGAAGVAIIIMLRKFKPDITICYGDKDGNTMKSFELYNAVFKRYGLALLYLKVGDEYWCSYTGYKVFLIGTLNSGFDDAQYQAELVEGWGQYMGNTVTIWKYFPYSGSQNIFEIVRKQRVQLENFRKDYTIPNGLITDADGFKGWYNCGIFHDLTDNGENTAITGYKDNVSAYTPLNMYNAFNSNILKFTNYRESLLSTNGNLQAVQVNELFTSYGY